MKIQVTPINNSLIFDIWGTFWHRDENNELTGLRNGISKKIKTVKVDLSDINKPEDLWDVLVEVK